jgi:hypothetical protein
MLFLKELIEICKLDYKNFGIMCNYMGHRVTKQQYIRLKQIEKQFGIAAALEVLRSGFEYGDWAVIVANENKTDVYPKLH